MADSMRVKCDSSLGEACCQCSEGNATSGGKFNFMRQNGILTRTGFFHELLVIFMFYLFIKVYFIFIRI